MRDNVNNYFGTAPDRGSMTGPVLVSANSSGPSSNHSMIHARSNTDDYWLSSMGSEGKVRQLDIRSFQFLELVFVRKTWRGWRSDLAID
jgi:hypothetical protein